MPRSSSRALPSGRVLLAVAILILFNAVAIALMLGGGLPAQPKIFAAWFAGDLLVGLAALGLTEGA